MRNVSVKFVGRCRSGAWFVGEFEFGLWAGRLVWFLVRHLGRQTFKEAHEA